MIQWTEWSEFLPGLRAHAPGCPTFECVDKLRDAAIEFLEDTRWWRDERVALTTTVAGQADYPILPAVLPEDAGITHIAAAWVGEREIEIAGPSDNLDSHPTERSSRYKLRLVDRALVRLTPLPDASGEAIVATVSWVPGRNAVGVLPSVFRRWREAIEKRAGAELKLQTGKPWSDPNGAATLMARYRDLKFDAANEAGPVGRQRNLRVRMWG